MNIKKLNFCAETAFICMNANKDRFSREMGDSLRRLFYGQTWAFAPKGIRSGCISANAIYESADTDDHYLSPLSVAAFIYENSDKYLDDWEAFKAIFILSCATHRVTSEENESLKDLNGKVPTKDKYKHLDIKLFKNGNEVDNALDTPAGYDDYEQKKIDGPLKPFFI